MKDKNIPVLISLKKKFTQIFNCDPFYISRAPGRAEIIGNHTDYNNGYALAAAISQSTYCAVSPREDELIVVFSDTFDTKPKTFTLKEVNTKKGEDWTNYIKAVVYELSQIKTIPYGFNLLVSSAVPSSGGVSSSAALELACTSSLCRLYKIAMGKIDMAVLCQKAENGPVVDSPCGFLDQAASGLSKNGELTFLDFQPTDTMPVSKINYIPIHLTDSSFVIVVDKNIKRNLGLSGYPARRAACEESLPILSRLMDKTITSLRDVSTKEFELHREDLQKINKTMRMRVEHVVYENERVLHAVQALKENDIIAFGKILTDSGKSALDLYELDEQTPELTFLVEKARSMEGVIGARNMGGGFSANILALVKNKSMDMFVEELSKAYKKAFIGSLQFIPFQPSQGVELAN